MRRILTAFAVPMLAVLTLPIWGAAVPAYADTMTVHALKQFGEPEFKPGFTHFPHANPDAPKGGQLTLGALGSFDSLNTIILRGVRPRSWG